MINKYLNLANKKLKQWTRHRYTKIALFFICFLLIFYMRSGRNSVRFTSAVKCKADIAKIAIPNNSKREAYLSPVGTDYKAMEEDFFFFMSKLTTSCGGQEHLGPPEEGGYDVCLGRNYDIRTPCLVYSFGVGHDFGFEKDAEKIFGCEIHSFDPSMNMDSHQVSENIHFHNFGVDNVETIDITTGWTMKRLSTIMKELGHEERHIDLLKMDIEFSEWLVLNDLITTNQLPKIRQLLLEVHTPEVDSHSSPNDRCSKTSPDSLKFMLRTLMDLKNEGMSLFGSRTNHRTKFVSLMTGKERYCCHNLHFVNIRHVANQPWVENPVKTQKMEGNCFLLTYFAGEVEDQVDEHIRKAIGRCRRDENFQFGKQSSKKLHHQQLNNNNNSNNNKECRFFQQQPSHPRHDDFSPGDHLPQLPTIAEEAAVSTTYDQHASGDFPRQRLTSKRQVASNCVRSAKGLEPFPSSCGTVERPQKQGPWTSLLLSEMPFQHLDQQLNGYLEDSTTVTDQSSVGSFHLERPGEVHEATAQGSKQPRCLFNDSTPETYSSCRFNAPDYLTPGSHQHSPPPHLSLGQAPLNFYSDHQSYPAICPQYQAFPGSPAPFLTTPPSFRRVNALASCRFAGIPTFSVVRRRSFTEEFAIAPLPGFNFDFMAGGNANFVPIRSYQDETLAGNFVYRNRSELGYVDFPRFSSEDTDSRLLPDNYHRPSGDSLNPSSGIKDCYRDKEGVVEGWPSCSLQPPSSSSSSSSKQDDNKQSFLTGDENGEHSID